jgi:competence protein ComFB
MKLITKDGVVSAGAPESGTGGIESAEATLLSDSSSLLYKTKLKIEIEPEAEIKEPVRLRQPRSRSVSLSPRESKEDLADFADAPGDAAPEAPPPPEAPPHALAVESIPDGTPYEKPAARPAEAPAARPIEAPAARPAEAPAARPRPETSVYDEVRALRKSDIDLLREEDKRREKKIQIENSLLHKSRSLINLSEILTKELLPSVMERMDVCTCPVCTGNVLALALNALPTKYVTTDEGKQYTQLEVYKRQNELDVMAALTRACLRVKDSPRHEIIDDLNE